MTAPPTTRWIYDFSEGSREMRALLGGKGAGIAEMARVLGEERRINVYAPPRHGASIRGRRCPSSPRRCASTDRPAATIMTIRISKVFFISSSP